MDWKRHSDLLKQARGKPPRVRAEIAREIGKSLPTLDRMLKKTKGVKADNIRAVLKRKGRNDKGRPRALTKAWIGFAVATFFRKMPLNYRAAHKGLIKRCALLGVPAPSESWTRRWIRTILREAIAQMFSRRRRIAISHKEGKMNLWKTR